MLAGDVVSQRGLPRKSLGAHGTLVGQSAPVILAFMDLKVGPAGESLFAVAALPVFHIFMDRFDVPKELGSVRENVAALGTRKPLLGHKLPGLVDVVLSRSVHGEGHRGGVLGRAVFAGEGSLVGVLGAHVILEGAAVHEAAGEADVALHVIQFVMYRDRLQYFSFGCVTHPLSPEASHAI